MLVFPTLIGEEKEKDQHGIILITHTFELLLYKEHISNYSTVVVQKIQDEDLRHASAGALRSLVLAFYFLFRFSKIYIF